MSLEKDRRERGEGMIERWREEVREGGREIRFEGTTGGEYAMKIRERRMFHAKFRSLTTKPAHFPSLTEEALKNHRFLSP